MLPKTIAAVIEFGSTQKNSKGKTVKSGYQNVQDSYIKLYNALADSIGLDKSVRDHWREIACKKGDPNHRGTESICNKQQ